MCLCSGHQRLSHVSQSNEWAEESPLPPPPPTPRPNPPPPPTTTTTTTNNSRVIQIQGCIDLQK